MRIRPARRAQGTLRARSSPAARERAVRELRRRVRLPAALVELLEGEAGRAGVLKLEGEQDLEDLACIRRERVEHDLRRAPRRREGTRG